MRRPKSIYIEPTNVCNLLCRFCFQYSGSMTRPKGFMELETFKKVVDDVKGFKPELVLHHSGESLLHPKLFEFIRYAKNKDLTVGITTNGILLAKDNFGMLDNGIDTINISLGGADEADYAAVRPGAEFAVVMDNIRRIVAEKLKRNAKTKIFVNIVKTKHNSNKIHTIRKYLSTIEGIDGLIVRGLVDWSGGVEVSDMRPIIRALIKPAIYYKRMLKLALKGTLCESSIESAAVLWDGTVVPCCFDYNGKLAMGNITESSFITIYNGERAETLRRILCSFTATKHHPTCGPCIFPL